VRVDNSSCRQTGFAAVAAIFLVVILAALGGFMVTFSNTQQLTSAQDVQGTRAYWAARAGLEWAIGAVVASSPVPPAVTPAAVCPVSAPPASIDGFDLAISCDRQLYSEGANSVYIFRFSSVASTGAAGSIGRVERSVSATMER
jgi:MSHA biogenesis protein MshP